MISRRSALQTIATGFGAALGSSMFPGIAGAASGGSGGPKRVIFFMQNQGFDPATCIPAGMKSSGSLAKAILPEPIKALEPFKERLHIINGLHGKHTSPSHSAFFGALGGYRGSDGVPPSGPTIDLRAEQGAARDASAAPLHRDGFHGEHDGQADGRESFGARCWPADLHALEPEPSLPDAVSVASPR